MYVPLRIAGGFLLVGLGLAGLVVPILPGLLFLVPGLALLSGHFHWARRLDARFHGARRFCGQKLRESTALARSRGLSFLATFRRKWA